MKVISQETFDEVVLENVIEFENSILEAVEEAIKDFEAQGVHLGNIVKNPRISEDKKKLVHDVLDSLNVIKQSIEEDTLNQALIISAIELFISQCRLSLAHRVLATKHNAYEIMLSTIKKAKDKNDNVILGCSLQAMYTLSITNPDILTKEGADLLLDLLSIWESRMDDDRIPLYLARWSLESCLKHERNRQALFDAGVPKALKTLLLAHGSNKVIAKGVSKALRAFTLDDDIRAEFGKAHDQARFLVEELDMINTCLDLAKGFLEDSDATSELLTTLSRLCVRAEYCQAAVDKGALLVINNILVEFPDNVQLNKQSINLLRTISGNDRVKEEIMRNGAYQLIVSALLKHQMSAGVCEAGCGAIGMLALRVPEHAKLLIQQGAAEAVVQAMKMHPRSKLVQKLGCMAVRNLASRVPENRKALQDCQVENVIRSAYDAFEGDANFKDLAKAALRDMELEVKLEEQWKGEKGEIDRD